MAADPSRRDELAEARHRLRARARPHRAQPAPARRRARHQRPDAALPLRRQGRPRRDRAAGLQRPRRRRPCERLPPGRDVRATPYAGCGRPRARASSSSASGCTSRRRRSGCFGQEPYASVVQGGQRPVDGGPGPRTSRRPGAGPSASQPGGQPRRVGDGGPAARPAARARRPRCRPRSSRTSPTPSPRSPERASRRQPGRAIGVAGRPGDHEPVVEQAAPGTAPAARRGPRRARPPRGTCGAPAPSASRSTASSRPRHCRSVPA